ncbi:MAG: Fic family protein [Desulfobacterales bacterium]|nr:Fic family protein [Desulfobacterales bacterium]
MTIIICIQKEIILKIPVKPPDFNQELSKIINDKLLFEILNKASPTDNKGRYLHWDKIRHLKPPKGLNNEQWWTSVKLSRNNLYKEFPLKNKHGEPFKFCVTDTLHQDLHWLDMNTAGTISTGRPVTNPNMRSTYLIKSLVEEAISSSQLEGASTTRNVAKEMIRQDRKPRDKSEQMILNNYHAMQFIRDYKDDDLTRSVIFELHRIVTEKTLDNPNKAGVLRTKDDDIHVVNGMASKVLHTPPNASDLEKRLDNICEFANGASGSGFIHPVIRAITLHFMLAYDHPFTDGNGRTARALFYWSMINQGYWLTEFISVSRIIKRAPAQYGRAFLLTETDDNDVTYFIIHQLEIIKKAITDLHSYLENKAKDIEYAQKILHDAKSLGKKLNFRQLSLLRHALKHPRFIYKINEHQNSHGISYKTARKDLLDLSDNYMLLTKLKHGRTFIFLSPSDLEDRIKKH